MTENKRTPLFNAHCDLAARMVPFGGWDMPVQYSGLSAEHTAVRTQVGMFDISHMGKFRLQGTDILEQLQVLVPSNLAKLQPGQAQYTVFLNAEAGIIDDVIFYCQSPEQWVVIVNGATCTKDRLWLEQHLCGVRFSDDTDNQILIALQGPQAVETLQKLVSVDLGQLGRFAFATTELLGAPAFIARTGYTGEDGFEIMVPVETGLKLWETFLGLGVVPCGLGARDTLRLEAAMHLYGQDMDETTTPLEASLAWVIDWQKPEFMGHEVLRAQKAAGTQKRLVGFEVQSRQIARHGYPITVGGEPIGIVTSGTLPPTINRPIGLGYVPKELSAVGTAFEIEIRGKQIPAMVVKRPFYRRLSN
jgi:aminomethyltransferase